MEYMTVREASELWGYSESTIRNWCRKDLLVEAIHAEKVGNQWRIPQNAPCPKPIKVSKNLKSGN